MEFNTLVDDALPLDGVITPDPTLKNLLEDMDPKKIKLWAFTNAYVTHAERVLRLLGVEGFFEGVTYCDYGEWPLVCKPMGKMFEKAEREAGVNRKEAEAGEGVGECFFVGTDPRPPALLSASPRGHPPQKKPPQKRYTTTYTTPERWFILMF